MTLSRLNSFKKVCYFLTGFLSIAVFLTGCYRIGEPRMRFGSFFGSPGGMQFPEPNNLGMHGFDSGLEEIEGMVYTCKGGFIDIGHVREAADRTAYLRQIVYRNLIRKKTAFSYRVIEPSRYYVKISYPSDWDDYSVPEREIRANNISISLGQYLAHKSLIWHEIITWYGFATSGIFPDTISSFSCEDAYSDLLGTCLGVQALYDEPQQYDQVMTKLLYYTLQELDAQPAAVAQQAAKSVEGKWYTGGFYFFVTMNKHNFDIGTDDCYISPVSARILHLSFILYPEKNYLRNLD